MTYAFPSNTNAQLFLEACERRRLRADYDWKTYAVTVEDPPRDLEDYAQDLGGFSR